MLSKTDLCASKPKYKMKTGFAIMRNDSFPGQRKLQQAKVLKKWKLPAPGGRGGEGAYVEIQDLASFQRSCVPVSGLPHHVLEWTKFLKLKAKKEGGEICRREEKVTWFKIEPPGDISEAILIFVQLYSLSGFRWTISQVLLAI